MLLLVLILVLVAFALLVVALLTGSVLWAWVSVAVSAGAAVVLLVDWLRGRSAARTGPAPGRVEADGPPPGMPGDSRAPSFEGAEAVTQVLPVVPRTWRPHSKALV